MPGTRCTVANCNNSKQKSKKAGENTVFHRFPKDEAACAIWVQKCRRSGKWNPKTSHVCSDHFKSDDYERDLQSELLNLPVKKKLKATAEPSLKLPKSDKQDLTSPTEMRLKKRRSKQLVTEILKSSATQQQQRVEPSIEPSDCSVPSTSQNILVPSVTNSLALLEQKYKNLKMQMETQTKAIHEYKAKIQNLEKSLAKFKSEYLAETTYRSKLEDSLKHFLSKRQMDLVLGTKKKVVWSSEDISNAFAIRYFSKRCYMYLREKKKYPLPGISSLQRWASRLNLRNGILKDVLRIMEVAQYDLTEMEKTVVLQFDEVKVNSVYEYDKGKDEVVGPHSQMQVAMVRGLFSKFKQPVFVGFDTKMTKEILNSIVEELHKINYNVVACVSDCGGGNVGLWKELGITIEQSYFLHPMTNEKIYYFADAPHLLKLIRNWLMDTGFVLNNGSIITAEPLYHLIESTDTEVNSCHKLQKLHVVCSGTQRQNVALAAQVLSHTTATALLHYLPGPNKEMAKLLSEFIEKVNKWFDVMNSFTTYASVKSKQPYGTNIEEQSEILDDMYNLMMTIRCTTKKSIQIFQKGILMSINSLTNLFKDLKVKYEISYILTHRLNQDALENFFSQIRGRGGFNDHPSPLDAIYRLRMIILGKNPGVVQKNLNTIELEPDEYIVTKVLKSTISMTANITPTDEDDSTDTMSISSNDHQSDNQPSTSSSRREDIKDWSENDGLEYLAGWVAKKFKEKYPDLGTHTYNLKMNSPYTVPKWISHLSFGGLIQPSDKWLNGVKILTKIFTKFNKDLPLRKGPNLVSRMAKIAIRKVSEVPPEVIKAYLLQRTFIRIKYLNNKKKETQTLKRKIPTSKNVKVGKKMRKLTT